MNPTREFVIRLSAEYLQVRISARSARLLIHKLPLCMKIVLFAGILLMYHAVLEQSITMSSSSLRRPEFDLYTREVEGGADKLSMNT